MKKLIVAVLAAMSFATADAQYMNSFGNVGVGVEAGITGFGVQASVPLVTDHIVLNVGYQWGWKISVNGVTSIDKSEPNDGLKDLNNRLENEDPTWSTYKQFPYLTNDIDIDASLKFGNNFKVMADLYPSKNSSFHFTIGALFGKGDIFTLNASVDDNAQEIFHIAKYDQDKYNMKEHNAKPGDAAYEDFIFGNLRFNVDEQTFGINGDDLEAEVSVKANKVKPYVGIGFGRAIPKKRVGVQFDLGAWFHGKPTLSSPNEITYDPYADGIDGVGDIMSKIQFFPQMTLRLTGRIF